MRRYLALARLANGPRLLVGSLLGAPGQAAIDLLILLALRYAAVVLGAAPALLIGLSAVLGLSQPATGPAARTAWMTAATDADTRVTAFSYCSATQDIGFVAGPRCSASSPRRQ